MRTSPTTPHNPAQAPPAHPTQTLQAARCMPHAALRLPHAAHRVEAPPRPSVSQWRTATSAAERVAGRLSPTLAAR